MTNDYITLKQWGESLTPPITNRARLNVLVKRLKRQKMAYKLNNRIWVVMKTSPDVRIRNSDGSIRFGRPTIRFLEKKVKEYIPVKMRHI